MSTYDAFAQKFAKTREQQWPDLIELIDHPLIQSYLLLDIVDIGAGSGRLIEYLNTKVTVEKFRGYDLSSGMVEEAKKRYPQYEFKVGDMTKMRDVPAADLLFFIASFHHLVDPLDQSRCLDTLARIIKPGGRVAFLNWNLTSEKLLKKYPVDTSSPKIRSIPFDGTPRLYRAWGVEELCNVLENSGFNVLYANTTLTGANIVHIFERI